MSSLEIELTELLSESPQTAQQRELTEFDVAAGNCRDKIVLIGAGGFGRVVAAKLRSLGIAPIGFTDNNPNRWSDTVDGVSILSPEEAANRYGNSATFVVTVYSPGPERCYKVFREQFLRLGCKHVSWFVPLFWKYASTFLPYYCFDLPSRILRQSTDIWRCFRLLATSDSQQEYVRQLRLRLFADGDVTSERATARTYFPEALIAIRTDEYFVDCGAYDGDTLREFIDVSGGHFARLVSYEADPQNYVKLQKSCELVPPAIRSCVDVRNAAVWSHRCTLHFNATGNGAASVDNEGTIAVQAIRLDEDLADQPITFIKMDIEGAECQALEGAGSIIRQYQPVLAICLYHSPGDLWNLPLLIEKIQPGYQFHLIQHNEQGLELVCYALPEQT